MDELQTLIVKGENGQSRSIAYRFARAQPGKPVFIWFCGFKSDMDSIKGTALAAWARERGAGCLRFDYSGHGQSGGLFEDGTVSRWLGEARAAAALVPDGHPYIFVASSMGGWIALLLAREMTERNAPGPSGIALIAPAWNMTGFMWERASEEARQTLLRDGIYFRPSAYGDPYPITKALIDDGRHHLMAEPVATRCPVRILHGVEDTDIPWQHSLELLDRLVESNVRLTLVKDSGHRLSRPQDMVLLFSILSEFVDSG